MSRPFSFYLYHLENVSRSFSFCISALNTPNREWVALSYLLLRIIDTVEDSTWDDASTQQASFQQLKVLLSNYSLHEYTRWRQQLPDNIIPEEQKLIADLPFLLEDLKQAPSPIQEAILRTTEQMINGMCHFISPFSLDSLARINQYCFFVAGIVGELLTTLFTFSLPTFSKSTLLTSQAIHFGLFLQKVNLLKDRFEDERQGRIYVSDYDLIQTDIAINAQKALDYIIAIPIIAGRSYRLFCSWSLFIGLASLRWINKNWVIGQDKYKISLQETRSIINHITQIIDDNLALKKLFQDYIETPSLTSSILLNKGADLPDWFRAIYSSSYDSFFWQELNIIP